MTRKRNEPANFRPLSPCGLDVGQPKTWVVELEGARKAALETGRTRLIVSALVFAMAFVMIGLRLVDLTLLQSDASAQIATVAPANTEWRSGRADIVDRNGTVLATTLPTNAVYANPRQIRNPDEVAGRLASVLKGIDEERLKGGLASDRSFTWVGRCLSPRETDAVNDLGIPGVYLQHDECRYYPHDDLFSHVVGYSDIDGQGIAGMEKTFEERLRGGTAPLELSLDMRLQHIMAEELQAAMTEYSGIGASGLIMDVDTGEILAMVSLPTFDPDHPGAASDEARFNRATLGVYEVGSVFKIFSAAAALDAGAVRLDDGYDVSKPIRVAGYTINDFKPKDGWMSIPEIFLHSSNIGTVHMAMEAGTKAIQNYFGKFGLLKRGPVELPENGSPLVPAKWREINTMTISYGHGLAVTPVQVVRALSAMVNGGELLSPTLVKRKPGERPVGEQVISEQTSEQMRWLMRLVVAEGTGRNAEAPGYMVGGKTGTADKLKASGGYDRNNRIASFAGAFPMDDPQYAIFAMVDEPKPTENSYGYATAGWVVAPAIKKIVQRMGPVVGLEPRALPSEVGPDPLFVPVHLKGRSVASQ
ncbi:peptidoglycan D,D-transpeptidase FtsI family protein [Fodinicurvata sediminis]|uniref:peptidoglycan D,D-transpeptidase FtsI family protein n=1 Tax=Fodinicurvata sediminis TaxID=1121832 RepID=UPI0003B63B1C|nr:penicillin-binding protein 2 [Fodinicurvata sediminis]